MRHMMLHRHAHPFLVHLRDPPLSEPKVMAHLCDRRVQMREVVRRIACLFPTAIISGRGRQKVQRFVGLEELYYAGSHGMDITGPQVLCPFSTKSLQGKANPTARPTFVLAVITSLGCCTFVERAFRPHLGFISFQSIYVLPINMSIWCYRNAMAFPQAFFRMIWLISLLWITGPP